MTEVTHLEQAAMLKAARLDQGHATAHVASTPGLIMRKASTIQAERIRWLWPGRFARGKVSIIAGNPGLGKSQTGIYMAAIVSNGGLWPVDGSRCESGSVLILSAEDDAEDTIKPRLQAAGANCERVHIVDAAKGGDGEEKHFDLTCDLPALEATLEELGDVSLLIIDPLPAYLGSTDSHKNAEVRGVLAKMAKVASKYSCAVVCVSHLSKGGHGDVVTRIMGSLGFAAAARAVWVVVKDKEDETRRLFLAAKNNLGPDDSGLAFRVESSETDSGIQTSHVAWERDAVLLSANDACASDVGRPPGRLNECKAWLCELLADGPVPANEIYQRAQDLEEFSRSTVNRAKKDLGITSRKSAFTGHWNWHLPEKAGSQDPDTPDL